MERPWAQACIREGSNMERLGVESYFSRVPSFPLFIGEVVVLSVYRITVKGERDPNGLKGIGYHRNGLQNT